jgi:hypothetical protein
MTGRPNHYETPLAVYDEGGSLQDQPLPLPCDDGSVALDHRLSWRPRSPAESASTKMKSSASSVGHAQQTGRSDCDWELVLRALGLV